ncbi:unnamed protein product, partial [Laminaria digitata]
MVGSVAEGGDCYALELFPAAGDPPTLARCEVTCYPAPCGTITRPEALNADKKPPDSYFDLGRRLDVAEGNVWVAPVFGEEDGEPLPVLRVGPPAGSNVEKLRLSLDLPSNSLRYVTAAMKTNPWNYGDRAAMFAAAVRTVPFLADTLSLLYLAALIYLL